MSDITERLSTAIADRYKIESHLGQGGMATVYLAHDVKHDRKVALKVLRPELAAVIGAERFLQEIKVTANLQHPHILPLHDSGEADTFLYYVMPYIEGESLRDKLDREKQLGIEDAIDITKNVAAALDYAHRQGVIHRDIKPENILLHDGQAQVADFGIALAVSEASGNRLTETGLSIGTPHYMSPEQAMGDRELDSRSDVYSLGAMLYEMLTGDPPYTGSTAQAIVAKVITEKAPPVTAIRDTVPSHVAAAVEKSLSKLPADRFTTAADFAVALSQQAVAPVAAAGTGTAGVTGDAQTWTLTLPKIDVRRAVPWVLVAAMAVATWWFASRPAPVQRIVRLHVALPEDAALGDALNGRSIALSPDGSQIVYVGDGGQLYLRRLDQLEARPLPGTSNAHTPFFSPDGAWVGYSQPPDLKKVALAWGPPLTIGAAPNLRGASWTPEGTIVFAPTNASGLLRVSDGGGTPDTLTRADSAGGSDRLPQVLPGGRAILFTHWVSSVDDSYTAVLDTRTGETTRLLAGVDARYVATGHLVYATADGSLLAVPFDVNRLEVTGNPVALLEGVTVKASAVAEVAIAGDGTLLYVSGLATERNLIAADRRGVQRILVEELNAAGSPRVSPDGRHIALRLVVDGNTDIWIFDVSQGTLSRLTFEGNNDYPVWSLDGRYVYFGSARQERDRDIYRRAADGSGAIEEVLIRDGSQWEFLPVRGDSLFVFREGSPTGGRDIWVGRTDGSDFTPYVATEFNERAPAISPDGRWLAYTSNESGVDEIYVREFPEPSGRWQVSTDGGVDAVWAVSGSEIYYRDGQRLIAVPMSANPTPTFGQRETLFEWRATGNSQHAQYDINSATDEFVALVPRGDSNAEMIVVLNWFEELRARTGSN